MRAHSFGEAASTQWNRELLENQYGERYCHHRVDIRDRGAIESLFQSHRSDIDLIIHTAAQPSHD
jgi:CDP-paratose 2-epimerase